MIGAAEACKAGGSLLRNELPPAFVEWLRSGPPRVLLPGGGAAADVVRGWQAAHGMTAAAAHWLAIRALGLSAAAWAALLDIPVAASFGACLAALSRGDRLVAFDPGPELVADPAALPVSWDATSDSIAAWATGRLGFRRLTVCKAVGPPASLAAAVAAGWLDPLFPALAAGLEVHWLNALAAPPARTIAVLQQERAV